MVQEILEMQSQRLQIIISMLMPIWATNEIQLCCLGHQVTMQQLVELGSGLDPGESGSALN